MELWWNPRGTLPQGRPGPPRSLSGLRPQGFQLWGKKGHPSAWVFLVLGCFTGKRKDQPPVPTLLAPGAARPTGPRPSARPCPRRAARWTSPRCSRPSRAAVLECFGFLGFGESVELVFPGGWDGCSIDQGNPVVYPKGLFSGWLCGESVEFVGWVGSMFHFPVAY